MTSVKVSAPCAAQVGPSPDNMDLQLAIMMGRCTKAEVEAVRRELNIPPRPPVSMTVRSPTAGPSARG